MEADNKLYVVTAICDTDRKTQFDMKPEAR